MKHLILDLAILIVVVLGNCLADARTDVIAIGPVHAVTAERGVVPPGTSVVILLKDTVKTRKASRGTSTLRTPRQTFSTRPAPY